MKKDKREPYRALGKVYTQTMAWPSLCHFCRYSRWEGDCYVADLYCDHPLNQFEIWEPDDVWQGSDCWAFRPNVDIDEAADMVGIWLNGQYVA